MAEASAGGGEEVSEHHVAVTQRIENTPPTNHTTSRRTRLELGERVCMAVGDSAPYSTPPAPGYHGGSTVMGSSKTYIISTGTCFLFTITM